MTTKNVTLRVEEKTYTNKETKETIKYVEYTLLDINGIDVVIKPKDNTGKQVLACLLNK